MTRNNQVPLTSQLVEQQHSGILHIQGVGRLSALPDVAHISISVETRNRTVGESLKDNAAKVSALLTAIQGLKIEKNKIKTTGFTVRPVYKVVKDRQTDQVEYWSVTNSIAVKVINIDILGDLLGTAGQSGSVNGPWFSCSNQEALEDSCRESAIKDAMRKAEIYCKAAGLKLKSIADVSEQQAYYGHSQKMALCATRDGGAPPIEAGEQDVSINVIVQFVIDGAIKPSMKAELVDAVFAGKTFAGKADVPNETAP